MSLRETELEQLQALIYRQRDEMEATRKALTMEKDRLEKKKTEIDQKQRKVNEIMEFTTGEQAYIEKEKYKMLAQKHQMETELNNENELIEERKQMLKTYNAAHRRKKSSPRQRDKGASIS